MILEFQFIQFSTKIYYRSNNLNKLPEKCFKLALTLMLIILIVLKILFSLNCRHYQHNLTLGLNIQNSQTRKTQLQPASTYFTDLNNQARRRKRYNINCGSLIE